MQNIFIIIILSLISLCANAKPSTFTPLYHFKDNYYSHDETNLILTSDKQTIYGHREKNIFRYALASGTFELIKDAGNTENKLYYSYHGQLTLSKNQPYLYGVKSAGIEYGAVYRLNLSTLSEEILHQFRDYRQEGYIPMGGLVLDAKEQYLYGVTNAGGLGSDDKNPWSLGVIYRITLNSPTPIYQVLHYFGGDHNGGAPLGNLVLSPDGQYLYGITDRKGEKNCGTIFKLELSQSKNFPLTTLYSFDCIEEGRPNDLIGSEDGQFIYGTAYKNNWRSNPGVVFRMNVKTSKYENIHHFNKSDGLLPIGVTISKDNKTLYGATQLSGRRGYKKGNIYQISLENGTFAKLHDFNQYNKPVLIEDMMVLDDTNNVLYGLTSTGGLLDKGMIFQLTLE